MRVFLLTMCVILYLPWCAAAQSPGNAQDNMPVYREQDRLDRKIAAENQAEVSSHSKTRHIDKEQVSRDAIELQRLAQSVSAELRQAEKGAVSKDLGEDLKKIQKLSKRLRSELYL